MLPFTINHCLFSQLFFLDETHQREMADEAELVIQAIIDCTPLHDILKGKISTCFSENIPKLFEYHTAQNQILTTSLYYNATSKHSGGFILKGKDLSIIEIISADTFKKATALAFHTAKKLIAAATSHDLGIYHQNTKKEVKRFSIHATTSDAEDGNLSQAIQWSSSREKDLGSGRTLDVFPLPWGKTYCDSHGSGFKRVDGQ